MSAFTLMTLLRQGGRYIAAGLMQLLLDWLVFVAATAAGLPPVPGNLLGRWWKAGWRC